MTKKYKGHHEMKMIHNTKEKPTKLIFLKIAKYVPQELSSISMRQVQQIRS
jgi:hypothetical protein